MADQEIHIEEVKTPRDLNAFIRFPWQVYQGDPYWVPPLVKDQISKFSPSNPFRSHAKMIFFLATRREQLVGRIAGIIDYHFVEFHQEKTGFFGFFESISDEEVAKTLLSRVENWLREAGLTKMMGPMNPSTNDECGLLIEGFDSSPCLMMPYNPRYCPALLEASGMKKAMDLYAYWLEERSFPLDRLNRIMERLQKREPRLRIRSLNIRRLDEELKIVKEIYNQAWSRNWGFVPLTEAEIDDLAKNLKPLVVPDLVLFAYLGEEPVGFAVSLPDYNQVLKHLNGKVGVLGALKFLYYSRKIKSVRVMLLGVKKSFQKRGVEALLYTESFKRGIRKGYPQAEGSWILETNVLMQRGLEAIGGRRYKTYRIYEIPL